MEEVTSQSNVQRLSGSGFEYLVVKDIWETIGEMSMILHDIKNVLFIFFI